MEDDKALDTLILAAERGMKILALLPGNQLRTPVAESFRRYCEFVTSQCDALAIAERFVAELDAARAHLDQIRPSDFRLTYELSTGEEREFGKATATETLLEASKHSRRLAFFVKADDQKQLERFHGAIFDQWQLERCVNAAVAEVRHVRLEFAGSAVDEPVAEDDAPTVTWHPASSAPPKGFHSVPIRGNKIQLARQILPNSDNARVDLTLNRKLLEDSGLWGRKMHRTEYEVYFADERRFDQANQRPR